MGLITIVYISSYAAIMLENKVPNLPNYFRISRQRIVGFIPFSRVLVLYDM